MLVYFLQHFSSRPDVLRLMTQDRIQNQISRQGCKIVNSWYTEEWLPVTLTHVGKLLGSSSSIITLASWGGRRQKGKGVTCSHWWWQVQQRNSLHPSKHWHQKLFWKCSLWYAVFFCGPQMRWPQIKTEYFSFIKVLVFLNTDDANL